MSPNKISTKFIIIKDPEMILSHHGWTGLLIIREAGKLLSAEMLNEHAHWYENNRINVTDKLTDKLLEQIETKLSHWDKYYSWLTA